jgi:hypothetical protein
MTTIVPSRLRPLATFGEMDRECQIVALAMRMHGRSARADAWWAVEEMWHHANATTRSLYMDCARVAFDWLVRPEGDDA